MWVGMVNNGLGLLEQTNMDARLAAVIDSVWDFAAPGMVVVKDTSGQDEWEDLVVQQEPPLPGGPCSNGNTTTTNNILSGWQPPQWNQRWLVAIISLLFLYWIWSEDAPGSPPAPTTRAASVGPAASDAAVVA